MSASIAARAIVLCQCGHAGRWHSSADRNRCLIWRCGCAMFTIPVERMQVAERAAYRDALIAELDFTLHARTCASCGCTDDDCRGCIERTGEPCRWVAAALCSACAGGAA